MSRKPPPEPPSADAGAALLGRQVAANMRHLRHAREMSLDALARASGVSRAALSQIETCKSSPTLGVLWKIAAGFGVPFSELIGEPRFSAAVLRRAEMQVLRSDDGRFESRPLVPAGTSAHVEMYELHLAPRARHLSDPHAPGTREVLVVLAGALVVEVAGLSYELAAGDTLVFAADQAHAYVNPGRGAAQAHDLILYGPR